MADWRQIQARIRKAKNAADAPAKLYELYQRTRDAMVAWELALIEEKAERTSEAVRWYTVAAQRFRRADWKKKAEAALTRLGAPLPAPGDEPAVEPRGMAPEAEEPPAALPVLGEIIDITQSAAEPAETHEAPAAEHESADAATDAADKRGKKRRRGRRGGRGRRRKGAAPSSLPSQAFVETKSQPREPQPREPQSRPPQPREPQSRPPQPREPMPRAPIPRPIPVPPAPEPRARFVEEAPEPMLPSERTAHGRAGDPALASRLVHLESKLRRLVSSPLHRLDEADEAPAGPGVFLLSDSDQISTYYVESCQTLRVGLGNLSRGGRAGKSGRGGYLGETGLKAKLAEHLGISEAKVNQYLKDHCVVRWIQLDDDAPLVAHFAIAVLRTPLNMD
jgi:hypothetical protein